MVMANRSGRRKNGRLSKPFVDRKGLESVYWGDTHLHTAYSTDAGMIGNTLSPDEAYRFARGEEVTSSTGVPARLVRPPDFLVVSDHAENLGLAPMIKMGNRLKWGTDLFSGLATAGTIAAYVGCSQ